MKTTGHVLGLASLSIYEVRNDVFGICQLQSVM
jgi:hypothetical protein